MQKRINRLKWLTNEKNKENDIIKTRSNVKKNEWRKDEKTARKIDIYNLIVEEKTTSRSI